MATFMPGSDIDELLRGPGNDLDVHTTASVGDLDFLLTLDFDLNMRNLSEWTPIMYAAYYDHVETVEFLLNRGASGFRISNDQGRTPLMLAAMNGNEFLVKRLLRFCGGIAGCAEVLEERDHDGKTALYYAAACAHDVVTKTLLELGADPDVRDERSGFTPLMEACHEGNASIVQWLVLHGANVNISNEKGENARSLAIRKGHDQIVKMLIDAKRPLAATMPSILDGPTKLAEKIRLQAAASKAKGKATPRSLQDFFKAEGIHEKYLKNLQENNVNTLDQLYELRDEDLVAFGITLLGPRRKITAEIARWRAAKELESPLKK